MLALDDLVGLLDDFLALSEDELDVAGVGHVGVNLECMLACGGNHRGNRFGRGRTYATVSTVCSPSLLRSLVDLDVLDNQGTGVEALGVSVGLGILEQAEEELGRLDGPAGLGDAKLLACKVTPSAQKSQRTTTRQ